MWCHEISVITVKYMYYTEYSVTLQFNTSNVITLRQHYSSVRFVACFYCFTQISYIIDWQNYLGFTFGLSFVLRTPILCTPSKHNPVIIQFLKKKFSFLFERTILNKIHLSSDQTNIFWIAWEYSWWWAQCSLSWLKMSIQCQPNFANHIFGRWVF